MKKFALVSALGLMASLPAFAGQNQFHVAADLGRSAFGDDLNTACTRIAATSCKKSDTAYRFSAGYDFTKNFGVELGYGNYGKTTVTGATGSGSIQANAFQLVGTGTLPVMGNLSLTAKAGIAAIRSTGTATGALAAAPVLASSKVNKSNFVWGVGAEYALSPAVSLRAGFEDLGTIGNATTIGNYKLSDVSVGAVFKF